MSLRIEGPPEAMVLADAHLATQVFVNLIANAVDAMEGAAGSPSRSTRARAR